MADEEQFAILRQGREAWNAWRQEHPGSKPDLCGASLRRYASIWAHLTLKADLRWTNLSGGNLRRAKTGHSSRIPSSSSRWCSLRAVSEMPP